MTGTSRPALAGIVAVAAFVACAAAANAATARLGLVPVGFGFAVTAGTYAAGLALLARDAIQDTVGRQWVLAAVAAGAVLSWLTATPKLAVASAAAFAIAELIDFAAYTPLRRRGWARAAIASGTVGGLVDTVVFLQLAGFPTTPAAVTGQLVGKALWATAVPVLLVVAIRAVRRRAVSDTTVDPSGA